MRVPKGAPELLLLRLVSRQLIVRQRQCSDFHHRHDDFIEYDTPHGTQHMPM